jgi:hypothetical protein
MSSTTLSGLSEHKLRYKQVQQHQEAARRVAWYFKHRLSLRIGIGEVDLDEKYLIAVLHAIDTSDTMRLSQPLHYAITPP